MFFIYNNILKKLDEKIMRKIISIKIPQEIKDSFIEDKSVIEKNKGSFILEEIISALNNNDVLYILQESNQFI